jgi:hypothetical protein
MNLKPKTLSLFVSVMAATALSGCATYRTDSNISSAPDAVSAPKTDVLISEGVPDRKYSELGPIEVSVKKLTAFNKDPTKEQANEALVEKARSIGADAVIKVTYQSGVGMTTWGYMDAKGIAVKFIK